MLIEVDGLQLSIGGTQILHDVHLALNKGEIYGLLGPNGAGKTTTISAILGLLPADAGHIRVFGGNPRHAVQENHRRLGVLPEESGFYDWMSAEEYLGFFASLYGCSYSTNDLRARLSTVGLQPRSRQVIHTYSRGMRQRLALARALIADPKLVVLDEPTNGLDPRGRREIHDVLLGLASRGVGILLCTHLLDDVDRLCRRIGIIVEGRTIIEGEIATLIRSESRLPRFRLRLAEPPPDSTSPIANVSIVAHEGEWWIVDLDPGLAPNAAWRELLFRGWPVTEIRRESGGLEDLYLALTERASA